MVRFNFAKVLCNPDKVAFGNQIVSVCELFANWNHSVYIYIYTAVPVYEIRKLDHFVNQYWLVYEAITK